MNYDNTMKADRLAGADAIVAKAVTIGTELDVIVSECAWDIGVDVGHEYAHRLDLSTASHTVRLYFSDLDLRPYCNESRKKRIEDQLYRGISQLIARAPSATYTYQ